MPNFVALAAVTKVLLSTVSSSTRWEMSRTGRGLRRMEFTTVKIVALAPIPRAKERMQTRAKPGLLRMERSPKRMSWERLSRFMGAPIREFYSLDVGEHRTAEDGCRYVTRAEPLGEKQVPRLGATASRRPRSG